MTRRRRAVGGAISTLLQVLVLFGSQLLISPIVLKNAGSETLGEYSVVTQLVSYLVLIDLGFGQALQRFIARANGVGNQDQLRVLFGNARAWLWGIDVLRSAVVLAAVAYLSLRGSGAETTSDLPLALPILALWFFVRGAMAGYVQGLTALQHIAIVNYLTMVGSVVRLGVSIALLAAGFGLSALVWGIVVAEFLLHFGSMLVFSIRIGRVPLILKEFSWTTIRPVAVFGVQSVPIGLAATSTLHSDSLISASLFGAGAASILFTTKLPVLHGTMLINRIIYSATPALYELHAQEQNEKLRSVFQTLHRYNFSISLVLAFGLILFHEQFVALWVGIDQYGGRNLTLLFSLYVIIMTTANVNTQFVVSRGGIKTFSIVSLVQAGAVMLLSVVLGWKLGIFGIVLGVVIAQAMFGGAYLWWVTLREFIDDPRDFFLSAFVRPLFGVGLAAAVVFGLMRAFDAVGFFLGIVLFLILSGLSLMIFVATRAEVDTIKGISARYVSKVL